MAQTSHPISVLIVDPLVRRNERAARSVRATPGLRLVGAFHDLNACTAMVKVRAPTLTIVARDVLKETAFAPVRACLERARAILWTLTDAPPDSQEAGAPYNLSMVDVRNAGGLGPFIANRVGKGPVQPAATSGIKPWKTVVIGASTGGVEALIEVLRHLPADGPPTLVVQHIRSGFLDDLVALIGRKCRPKVVTAENNALLETGHVFFAPAGETHLLLKACGRRCLLKRAASVSGHLPSVDALFSSAAQFGSDVVAVLLTGMGRDGAEGMAGIFQAGGWTIAQDKASSTVYGMPQAAMALGAVSEQLPLAEIGPAILRAAANQEAVAG